MSLISEVMAEVSPIVNEVLGDPCTLINGETGEQLTDEAVLVVFHYNVEIYQDGLFAGLATTASFAKANTFPEIGDTLTNLDSNKTYTVQGLKSETASRIDFVIMEKQS